MLRPLLAAMSCHGNHGQYCWEFPRYVVAAEYSCGWRCGPIECDGSGRVGSPLEEVEHDGFIRLRVVGGLGLANVLLVASGGAGC